MKLQLAPQLYTEHTALMTDATEREEMDRESLVSRDNVPTASIRIKYAGYLFVGFIVCLLLKDGLFGALSHLPFVKHGCETADNGAAMANLCFGHVVVYRASFSLAVFFLLHLLLASDLTCCFDNEVRRSLQSGLFCFKSFILVLLFFASFFIPNGFFAVYAWICMGVSAIFLLVQIILIVDFAHQWNEEWGDRSEENPKWGCYLVSVSLACLVFAVVLVVLDYVWFVPHSGCSFNSAVITITLLSAVIYTFLSIWVPHGSILPSALVFAYTIILCHGALSAASPESCSKLYDPNHPSSLKTILVTSLFAGVAMAYSVVSVGGSRSALSLSDEKDTQRNSWDDPELDGFAFFHIVMVMGSMYMSMLLTGWTIEGGAQKVDSTAAAMWVKLVTEWVTILMYLWSLLAPHFCCRDRDFGVTTDW